MSVDISRFTNRYNSLSAPVKATFWFAICSFLQRGISLITTPIFTRLMPTEEYGLYSTYISWETVLMMVVSLCLYKAMMNLYVKYDDLERVLSAVCGLEIVLTSIWFVIGVVLRNTIAKLLKIPTSLVLCVLFFFVFQSAFQCWSLYKRYIYDYRSLVVITLVTTAGSGLLSVIAVCLISATAESRAISTTTVVGVIGLLLYISIFRKSHVVYDKKIWMFALGFCIPLMPHYLSEYVLQSSDKLMINYMCGPSDVAIYSVAYSAGSIINLITNAINSTFAPYQYQKIKSGEYKLLSKRADQVLLFVGVMLAGIMLFSREIVLIFGGYRYIESVKVMIPICLGVYFNYMFQLFARVQEYYERRITVVIPSILCATLNLLTNYVFIKRYGYQAAAYTTFACYAFFCVLHYFFYRKVCRELLQGAQLYNIRGLAIISLGIIISGILIALINRNLWIKYGLIVALVPIVIAFRKRIAEIVKEVMING